MQKTKWVILDNVGIILGGTTLDIGKSIAGYVRGLGDREEATVVGFGFKSSTRNAAFVNGSLSEVLEMQDGYTRGAYHPCEGTISASLAVTEWQKASGRDLIVGIVAGYEVGNRVAEALHPTHFLRGFNPTTTVGGIGAAAAVGKILQLDAEAMCNALGIAAFMASIAPVDNVFGAYSTKPILGGVPARTGVESGLLAKQGLTGAPLEGDPGVQKGFCKIVTEEAPRLERMIEGLGEKYTIEEVYFKPPYASCRINHGPIEIATELKNKHGLDVKEIEDVLIRTYDVAIYATGLRKTDTNSPFILCQLSMSYAVAGALMDGEASLRQLKVDRIKDPEIHKLASKIRAVADPELQKAYLPKRPYVMEITMKDGRKVIGRSDYPKGDFCNPMTEEEIVAKYLGLAKSVIGEKKAKKVMDIVLNLENLGSVENLIAHMK